MFKRLFALCLSIVLVIPWTLSMTLLAAENDSESQELGMGYIQDDVEWISSIPVFDVNDYPAGSLEIPDFCDNSTSAYFPQIGSQGKSNSCTSFATTYYQFTYEANKANGIVTKPENTYSPQWTYSLVNGGYNTGTTFYGNYGVLSNQGALKHSDYDKVFDLNTSEGTADFTTYWSDNTDAKIKALETKASLYKLPVPVTSDGTVITFGTGRYTDAGLSMLKYMLSQGKIAVISAYFCLVTANITTEGAAHYGDFVALGSKVDPTRVTSHAVTIVGYDDNLEIDVNGDGLIEPAERGALKIANSHGTGSYNRLCQYISKRPFFK